MKDALWLGFWALCLLACAVLQYRITRRADGTSELTRRALLAGASTVVIGALVSIAASSDWNPLLMSAHFAPFWAFTVFGVAYSRLATNPDSHRKATTQSALLALAGIVLTPMALLLVAVLWVPIVLLALIVWARGRSRPNVSSARPAPTTSELPAQRTRL